MVGDAKVVDLVQSRFDMALRIGRLPASSLVALKLSPVNVVVCGAPSYLAERGRPESLDDLARHACLGYDYQWTARGWAFAVGGGEGDVVRISRPQYRFNNAEVLRALAPNGFGLVQLPTFTVAPDIEAGRLVPVLTVHPATERWVHVVSPPGRYLPTRSERSAIFLQQPIARRPGKALEAGSVSRPCPRRNWEGPPMRRQDRSRQGLTAGADSLA